MVKRLLQCDRVEVNLQVVLNLTRQNKRIYSDYDFDKNYRDIGIGKNYQNYSPGYDFDRNYPGIVKNHQDYVLIHQDMILIGIILT